MQQILYLDVGNSRIKAAGIQDGRWKQIAVFSAHEPDLTTKLDQVSFGYEKLIVASVRKGLQPADLQGMVSVPVTGISKEDIPAGRIRYKSLQTFGIDRFLACLGAWSLDVRDLAYTKDRAGDTTGKSPNKRMPVIVSDAGTACTIDVMDAEGVYIGGVIMPGLHMMIQMLAEKADGLYDVSPEIPVRWPPDTTEAALQAGTAGSFVMAWEAHVQKHLKHYPGASVWITGGDASFLEECISFTVQKDPALVFEGMRCFTTGFQ